jgi:hypothetical protein
LASAIRLGLLHVALRLLHLGVGFGLVDLVANAVFGVVGPFADPLARRLGGVFGIVEHAHDVSFDPLVALDPIGGRNGAPELDNDARRTVGAAPD